MAHKLCCELIVCVPDILSEADIILFSPITCVCARTSVQKLKNY